MNLHSRRSPITLRPSTRFLVVQLGICVIGACFFAIPGCKVPSSTAKTSTGETIQTEQLGKYRKSSPLQLGTGLDKQAREIESNLGYR